jgi:predicted  nucleic acid-binding Zn-ribbon protein
MLPNCKRTYMLAFREAGMQFRNYYRCARCGCEWTDVWSAQCDDDCPFCGARHMSPYKSEDIEHSAYDVLRQVADTFRRINGTCEGLSAHDKLAMLQDLEDAVFEALERETPEGSR